MFPNQGAPRVHCFLPVLLAEQPASDDWVIHLSFRNRSFHVARLGKAFFLICHALGQVWCRSFWTALRSLRRTEHSARDGAASGALCHFRGAHDTNSDKHRHKTIGTNAHFAPAEKDRRSGVSHISHVLAIGFAASSAFGSSLAPRSTSRGGDGLAHRLHWPGCGALRVRQEGGAASWRAEEPVWVREPGGGGVGGEHPGPPFYFLLFVPPPPPTPLVSLFLACHYVTLWSCSYRFVA